MWNIRPPTGPYGAKGVGEICTIPTTPAITNAIYNAVGVRVDRLPVDQELIARGIRQRDVDRRSTEPCLQHDPR